MSGHRRQVDTTEGPLLRPLLALAWPIVASQLLQVLYNLTDTFWVGRLGPDAVSALSFSFPIIFLILAIVGGFTAGGSVLVAQHVGASDQAGATRFAGQTLLVTALFSLAVSISGYIVTPDVLIVLGTQAGTEIHRMAVGYTRIMFLGNFGIFGFYVFQAVFRGWGDTKTPLYLMAFGVGLNLLIDPVFILGFDEDILFEVFGLDTGFRVPFALPRFSGLGVEGAAIATILSRGIGTFVGLLLLYAGRSGLAITVDDLRPRASSVRRLMKVATPLAIERSLTPIGITAMTAILAVVGPAAVAGYGIGMRYVALVFLPALGFAQGTEVAVGQNVGAGNIERAKRAALLSVTSVGLVMAGVGAIVIVFSDLLVSPFVTGQGSATVVDYGTDFLETFAFGFAFLGAFRVFVAAFGGAGHSAKALASGLIWLFGFRIPIPLVLLALGFGAASVWYGMTVAAVCGALFAGGWFLSGSWAEEATDPSEAAPEATDD